MRTDTVEVACRIPMNDETPEGKENESHVCGHCGEPLETQNLYAKCWSCGTLHTWEEWDDHAAYMPMF